MSVKLSKVSKLDGIRSWSLQAIETCPGSVSSDGSGDLVGTCSGCYATQGCYNFSATKALRARNKDAWKEDEWVSDMVKALKKEKFFRWLDSGDLYDLKLARKVYEIMQQTPQVSHWLPTRMYKFTKYQATLQGMEALPNVKVRYSSDEVDGSYTPGLHGSCIVPSKDAETDAHICTAPETEGKCNGCRACYSKDIPVIAYIAHGHKMRKLINIHAI